jgi:hypothetical protein
MLLVGGAMTFGWTRSALRGAIAATAVATMVAWLAGAVRVLPWVLDASVTWRVAAPFARGLAVAAVEAALAIGWPIGWALATADFVDRGEGRVLRLLGERPGQTVGRLGPQALVFAAILGAVSWGAAVEAAEPGRVITRLLAEGEAACASAEGTRTYTIPFLGATWLCAEGTPPRLVGQGPGPLASMVFSARGARVSGDLGAVDLDDAQIALATALIHVDELHLRSAAPWGHASVLGPASRSLAVAFSVALSALTTVLLILAGRAAGRVTVIVTAAAGPVTTLGLLRALEHFDAVPGAWLWSVVTAALGATIAVAWLAARLTPLWQTGRR